MAKVPYKVGYKKPPKHTQYKKGQSGNPNGRPKGKVKVADADAILNEVLSSLIPVNENGRARKISKLRALLTQTVNKGLKGDHRSTNLVLTQLSRQGVHAEPEAFDASAAEEEAKKEFETFLNEMAANLAASPRSSQSRGDEQPKGSLANREPEEAGTTSAGE